MENNREWITPEVLDNLLRWFNSFTHGDITYKDGNNFISRLKPKEVNKKLTKINKKDLF